MIRRRKAGFSASLRGAFVFFFVFVNIFIF